jgi:tetratricopeptide (TPR) repeat protein
MKTRFFVAVLTLAVGLVATGVRAQNGVARGEVVDENGKPVPEAKITLESRGGIERQYEAETNDKGEYQLIVSPGRYRITASKEDYQGASLEHAISPRSQTRVPDIRIVSRRTAAAAAVAEDEVLGPLKRAMELTQAGRLEEAEAEYKRVLAADPSVVEAHYNLGTIYLGRKDYPAAEGEFQQIIELSPETGEAYSALSRVYQEQGDNERALEVMTQGVAVKPEDVRMQLNLGVLYNNAQRPEEAEAAFRKVEALDPQYVRVQYLLGTLALNRGDVEEAVARLEKYLAEAPEDARDRATAQGLLEQLQPEASPES